MKARMEFGSVVVEADGDAKEVFAELAKASEVFGHSVCGACGSTHVCPVVREIDGNTYYEMQCKKCGCALGFGQRRQDGALFPRRKKDEAWLPNNGWVKRQQESAPARPQRSEDTPF